MTTEQIKERLAQGICSFKYTKKDGSERIASGTRNTDIIALNDAMPKGTGVERSGVITYYDLEKSGWRSFNEDSFVDFL